jgi:hypothetical protein
VKLKQLVLAFFEDEPSRDAAMRFCDTLIQKFWSHCTFEIHWCSVDDLSQGLKAVEAAKKAAEADLLVFSLGKDDNVSWDLRAWVRSFLALRREREGTLIGLYEATEVQTEKSRFLREIAHEGGLDYLTRIPEVIAHRIPDSLDSYAQRAVKVTSVLDEILKHSPLPPHPAM